MKQADKNRYIELGDFLKSRRNKIHPSQFGLPDGIRRRTPGLRREEVAQLSGVSLTWYTWLEQGRPIHVSDALLESLCKTLLLTKEERLHLFSLTGKTPPPLTKIEENKVSTALLNTLYSLEYVPAYIIDEHFNILAWNSIASKVFIDFDLINPEERNVLWLMFINEAYMRLFDDWTSHGKGLVARFRALYGKHMEDDWFADFIQRLQKESPAFCEFWRAFDVHGMSDIEKKITHPAMGRMTFEFNSFNVSTNDNLKLILHIPAPETDTGEKLRRIGELK